MSTILKLSTKTIALLWAEFYQGTGDSEKMYRAYIVLEDRDYVVPWSAVNAVGYAARIHGGDMGVPKYAIEELLYATGAIETRYATRKQVGGPAVSFWQIEPETAHSLLVNSPKLFGKKWQYKFGRRRRHELANMTLRELSRELETNDNLAASLAACKWIVSASKAIKETLKQMEVAR